jgi:starch synthase
LIDTVPDYTTYPAEGLGFMAEAVTDAAFARSLTEAVTLLRRAETWKQLQRRGMEREFSWKSSVPKYVDLYERAVKRKSEGADS